MKIKSLLLGSAAAFVAVTGAHAADAIVVEAEPMEYVKVCDMYGNGFFYIPGTETCMNINGYVRSTYNHASTDYALRDTTFGPAVTTNDSSWTVRGRLNFDVRNETEYGTLRSELRLQGGDANASGDQNVAIDRALISLAGFRLGYSDTYITTNHGYGAGTPAVNDGFYNYDQAIFFDYTATLAEGISVTVGVQDSNGANNAVLGNTAASPDFYAGFNASFGALTVAGTAIRDSSATTAEWAYKGSAIMGLGDSGWSVGGWYASDNGGTQYVTAYLDRSIDKEWGVQVNGALSSNFSVYGLYTQASGASPAGWTLVKDADVTAWAVGAIWAPVSGLTVQFEYAIQDTVAEFAPAVITDQSSDQFLVRVTRSF